MALVSGGPGRAVAAKGNKANFIITSSEFATTDETNPGSGIAELFQVTVLSSIFRVGDDRCRIAVGIAAFPHQLRTGSVGQAVRHPRRPLGGGTLDRLRSMESLSTAPWLEPIAGSSTPPRLAFSSRTATYRWPVVERFSPPASCSTVMILPIIYIGDQGRSSH